MSKSSPKPKRPSYEDGKLRDPEIAKMQDWHAQRGDDQRAGLKDLVKRSTRPVDSQ